MRSFLRFLPVVATALTLVRAGPTVTIPAGTVYGTTCPNGANAFLSLPFAVPPVGDLRWTSPQAYNQSFPSSGYNATKLGNICVQFGGTEFTDPQPDFEDCLYLNVWAPAGATSSSNLPVKVWIYGGGQQGGGIANPLFNGCNLAAHNTLLVSINYRLGPLGYLTLDEAGIGGNFATQDLLLGLAWVQSHISAFGGNPKKVVLFGESAGAENVFILSTLPQAPTLFNAAIWESGAGPQLAPAPVANTLGTSYATKLNCTSGDVASCLRAVTVDTLKATAPSQEFGIIYSGLQVADFQPHVDGKVIPEQPWSVGPKVPMIFGGNADEGGLFAIGAFEAVNVSAANYTLFLQQNFGAGADTVAKQYPLTLPAFTVPGKEGSPLSPAFLAIANIITDVQFTCPLYQAMLKATSNNIPVYSYTSQHTPSCPWVSFPPAQALALIGATHTSEIPMIFGNLAGQPLISNGNCTSTPAEFTISENLIAAWTAMAVSGNPSAGNLQWPQWDNSSSQGVIIGANSTSVGKIDYSFCQFWDPVIATYLSFSNSSAANGTSGGGSGGSGNGTTTHKNGAEKGVEMGLWCLTMFIGIAISVLMS
ncbi:alpha/beta-hydrolase [Stipitochalara longipes BDJ]|nr:alpha/beta-hydrolase [Stipitochalara longipes BDJ]